MKRTQMSGAMLGMTVALGAICLWSADAQAVDVCKAKIDRKTALVVVGASGVTGQPKWSDAPDTAPADQNTFNNENTCSVGGKLKNCFIDDPADPQLAANVPPENCRVCVHDAGATCCTFVRGCTPGLRNAMHCQTKSASTQIDEGESGQINATCDGGYTMMGGGAAHGYVIASGFPPTFTSIRLPLSSSSPSGDSGWFCAARNDSQSTSTLTCYARCCTLP